MNVQLRLLVETEAESLLQIFLENQVYTMMGYSTLNDQLIDQETAAAGRINGRL